MLLDTHAWKEYVHALGCTCQQKACSISFDLLFDPCLHAECLFDVKATHTRTHTYMFRRSFPVHGNESVKDVVSKASCSRETHHMVQQVGCGLHCTFLQGAVAGVGTNDAGINKRCDPYSYRICTDLVSQSRLLSPYYRGVRDARLLAQNEEG